MIPHSPGISARAATNTPLMVMPRVSGTARRVTSALVDLSVWYAPV